MAALDTGQKGSPSSPLQRMGGKCYRGSCGPSPQSCRELCLLLLHGQAPGPVSAQHLERVGLVGRQHISMAGGSWGCPTGLGGLWVSPAEEGSLLCGVLGFPTAATRAGLALHHAVLGAGCVQGRVGRCWGWQELTGASVPRGRETLQGLCWGLVRSTLGWGLCHSWAAGPWGFRWWGPGHHWGVLGCGEQRSHGVFLRASLCPEAVSRLGISCLPHRVASVPSVLSGPAHADPALWLQV